ncbi:MAG TPA: serine/threonine-protein kinase [Actinospica sp.]|jgi:serine/threonine protein kinase|nr:serine/threonine-protein kinase [Actinospica sp.]
MARSSLREDDPTRIGRFRLTARLGAGGMGVVYLGEAKDTGQVAVKVVRPEVDEDPEFRARFRREVALLTRVRGTCTVRVIEADTESTSPFLVTEYADGPSLSEHVKTRGPLDQDMLRGLATGLAEALVAIHEAGVVHRDLKPGNVLLSRTGPKVIDFGIAQAMDGTVLTRTGAVLGSPGFLAPEQVRGTPGQATDIFAWGLTVAYAASGRAPFGTGPAEVLPYRVLHDSPYIADVPDDLRPLVEAAVARDPEARPTAQDLLTRLTQRTDVRGAVDVSAAADDMTPTQLVLSEYWHAPEPITTPSLHDARPSSRRRSPLPYLAGAAALAVAIGAGTSYALANSGHSSSAAKTATGQTSAAAALPSITFGNYTGRKPSAIVMNDADGGGTIQEIHWTSWTATGAEGQGQFGTSATRITLSAPAGGRFTRMGQTEGDNTIIESYPDNDWPAAASPATAACTVPTSTQLLAAWHAATAATRTSWADPSTTITGYTGTTCWQDWIVTDMLGTGDGEVIFSWSTGALHLIPEADLQQFSDIVCKAPTAPKNWKDPDTGPAIC